MKVDNVVVVMAEEVLDRIEGCETLLDKFGNSMSTLSSVVLASSIDLAMQSLLNTRNDRTRHVVVLFGLIHNTIHLFRFFTPHRVNFRNL